LPQLPLQATVLSEVAVAQNSTQHLRCSLRNTGTYTIGDVIMYRMRQPPALAAAIVGTVVIHLAYLIPQMAGGGVLIKLLGSAISNSTVQKATNAPTA
jgi:Sodium:solute symporter family